MTTPHNAAPTSKFTSAKQYASLKAPRVSVLISGNRDSKEPMQSSVRINTKKMTEYSVEGDSIQSKNPSAWLKSLASTQTWTHREVEWQYFS